MTVCRIGVRTTSLSCIVSDSWQSVVSTAQLRRALHCDPADRSLNRMCVIWRDSSASSLQNVSHRYMRRCRFNFYLTFHHFLPVSLWAQNLPFQKILSSTLVCFCLSDWSHGSRPFLGFICLIGFYVLVLFLPVLVISTCGSQSWLALWSTFRRTKSSDWLIDTSYVFVY